MSFISKHLNLKHKGEGDKKEESDEDKVYQDDVLKFFEKRIGKKSDPSVAKLQRLLGIDSINPPNIDIDLSTPIEIQSLETIQHQVSEGKRIKQKTKTNKSSMSVPEINRPQTPEHTEEPGPSKNSSPESVPKLSFKHKTKELKINLKEDAGDITICRCEEKKCICLSKSTITVTEDEGEHSEDTVINIGDGKNCGKEKEEITRERVEKKRIDETEDSETVLNDVGKSKEEPTTGHKDDVIDLVDLFNSKDSAAFVSYTKHAELNVLEARLIYMQGVIHAGFLKIMNKIDELDDEVKDINRNLPIINDAIIHCINDLSKTNSEVSNVSSHLNQISAKFDTQTLKISSVNDSLDDVKIGLQKMVESFEVQGNDNIHPNQYQDTEYSEREKTSMKKKTLVTDEMIEFDNTILSSIIEPRDKSEKNILDFISQICDKIDNDTTCLTKVKIANMFLLARRGDQDSLNVLHRSIVRADFPSSLYHTIRLINWRAKTETVSDSVISGIRKWNALINERQELDAKKGATTKRSRDRRGYKVSRWSNEDSEEDVETDITPYVESTSSTLSQEENDKKLEEIQKNRKEILRKSKQKLSNIKSKSKLDFSGMF